MITSSDPKVTYSDPKVTYSKHFLSLFIINIYSNISIC